jgi:hypothetical protein
MGSPGSTVVEVEVEVAETAGSTARGQMRIRKNKRMPAHKGSCLLWRVLRAMVLLAMVLSCGYDGVVASGCWVGYGVSRGCLVWGIK